MRAPFSLFLCLVVLPCCSRSDAASRIVVTGSSSVAPLLLEIAKRFESQHQGVRIDVQSGGSSRGLADARKGLAQIGMVSRALRDDEKDLTAFPIAMDGVCMIVHQDNPVVELSNAQIAAIYRGEVQNWRQVGGLDAPITVVNKAEGRATLELFTSHFQLAGTAIKAQVVIGDNEQGVKTVAGNVNAIGYVSVGTAEYDASQGTPIKLLPLSGVAATTANVRRGAFPLARQLNLVTNGPPTGVVRQLIHLAQSDAVHDLVTEQCFVPLVR